jgi:hypothetical protein
VKESKIYLAKSFDDNGDFESWNQYISLFDAVSENNRMDIYVATPRKIGKFQIKTKPVRIKSRRKK